MTASATATLPLLAQLLPAVRMLPVGTDDRVQLAIARAIEDLIAVVETPLHSNRGERIDRYLRNAGVPEGEILAGRGYWCVAAVGEWWRDGGLEVPRGYASCDAWMAWAKATRRWSTTPVEGAVVLYGQPGDAQHGGLVVRRQPLVLSIEGNTTIESGYSRNGIAVAVKIVDPKTDPILGYCHPFPAPPVTPPVAAPAHRSLAS